MSSSKEISPAAKSARGRKPTNKPAPEKKQPQRGLGVAQLERLRLQERWRKMTEMPSSDNNQPLESVPVQYVSGGYGGDAAARVLLGSGAVVDHGVLDHHHQLINNNSPKSNLQHYLMQNPSDYIDHNNITFKKKRFSGEINGGMMREKLHNGSPSDHQVVQIGSPGLNIYANQNHNNIDNNTVPNYHINNINNNNNISVGDHLTLGFVTSSKTTSSDHIPQNTDHPHRQGVEIRAVHRRGNIDNNLVMEYEFFPGLNDSVLSASKAEPGSAVVSVGDHHDHDHHHHQEASSSSLPCYHHHQHANNGSGSGSGGAGTTSTSSASYNNNNNNNLDLSLKL